MLDSRHYGAAVPDSPAADDEMRFALRSAVLSALDGFGIEGATVKLTWDWSARFVGYGDSLAVEHVLSLDAELGPEEPTKTPRF